jgi:hypothetical protein
MRAASDFLSGRAAKSPGHESWHCTFDWFLIAHNLLKLSEGDYDNNTGSPATTIQCHMSISAPGSWDNAIDSIHLPQTGAAYIEPTPEQDKVNHELIQQAKAALLTRAFSTAR